MLRKSGSVIGESPSRLRFSLSSFLGGAALSAFVIFLRFDDYAHQESLKQATSGEEQSKPDSQAFEAEQSQRGRRRSNQCERQLETLSVKLSQAQQSLTVYEELKGLQELSGVLSSGTYYVAELMRSLDDPSSTALKTLCLRSLSLSTGDNRSTSPKSKRQRKIKAGDLVLSQGALLGEISSVNGDCFEMIPTASHLSSFEVRLEKSGIRGVAVGLGDQRKRHQEKARQQSRREQTAMEIKYLERSVPALLGERALLVRRRLQRQNTDLDARMMTKRRLPMFTVGEVVSAAIDENGLFQSALLATPLNPARIDYVLIYMVDQP